MSQSGLPFDGASNGNACDRFHHTLLLHERRFRQPRKCEAHLGGARYLPLAEKEKDGSLHIIKQLQAFSDFDATDLTRRALKSLNMYMSTDIDRRESAPSGGDVPAAVAIGTALQFCGLLSSSLCHLIVLGCDTSDGTSRV